MLVTYGGGVVDARGSMAGNTFSRNKGGAYVRARIKGVNSKSALQVVRRAVQSAASAAWSSLTAAQRTAWGTYALNTSWTNKLGASINIGGIAAFTRLYTLRILAGLAAPTAAPTMTGHASGTVVTFSAITSTQVVTLAVPTLGWDKDTDDDTLLIFQGMPMPPSRESAPIRFNFLQAIAGSTGSPESFPLALDATKYPFIEGDRLSLGLVHIDPYNRVSVRNVIYCFSAA